ncbi:acyl-CoA dehydrogenase family protein [Geotalea toluenoxydans]|nr:acyl-CoA dehydrogenase family protein [Geotalea toluenoxydans]
MFTHNEEIRIAADTIRQAARERIAPLAASIDATGELNPEVTTLLWDLGS